MDVTADGNYDIFLVDTGESEYVTLSDIRPLPMRMLNLPFQALECTMIDIESTGMFNLPYISWGFPERLGAVSVFSDAKPKSYIIQYTAINECASIPGRARLKGASTFRVAGNLKDELDFMAVQKSENEVDAEVFNLNQVFH